MLVTISKECKYCNLADGDHQPWCPDSATSYTSIAGIPDWVWYVVILPVVTFGGAFLGQWIGWYLWTL